MKITNKSNLPESIFSFLSQDFYDGVRDQGSFSVTEILKPIQEIILTRRHWGEIEIDAIDRIWSLFGQSVHAVLEKERGMEPLERISVEVLGRKINGKFDRIKNSKLYDFKITSAWSLVFKSKITDWRDQLSMYRWLYWKKHNIELSVDGAVVAILRDWSDKNLKDGGNYPTSPIKEIDIQLLSLGNTEEMIRRKITAIIAAEALPDNKLPHCTDAERWYQPKKKLYMRCAKYCPASKFCPQFKAEQEREAIEPAEELFEEPISTEII